jgi:predicted DNA-binding WGR domain protein
MAREYHLWVDTDLFGWITLERRWGRIGTRGQGTTISFPDKEDADRMADSVRERRTTALRRNGVSYHEVR